MQEDQFWLLVSLKLSGEATEEETAALDALLLAHPEMGLRVDILRNIWQDKRPFASGDKAGSLAKHLQRLQDQFPDEAIIYERDRPGAPGPALPVAPAEERIPVRHLRWLWLISGAAACSAAFLLLSRQMGHPKADRKIAQTPSPPNGAPNQTSNYRMGHRYG